jgi:hypothetical protein
MNEYYVEWAIHIDGKSPEDAACNARYAMTRPGTSALDFNVTTCDDDENTMQVDLYCIEPRIDVDISAKLLSFVEQVAAGKSEYASLQVAARKLIEKVNAL